jgi:hypothetical protein
MTAIFRTLAQRVDLRGDAPFCLFDFLPLQSGIFLLVPAQNLTCRDRP